MTKYVICNCLPVIHRSVSRLIAFVCAFQLSYKLKRNLIKVWLGLGTELLGEV